MLAHERAERIVERLRERGTVSAQELVRTLQVSPGTGSLRICRLGDLNDLITTADADEVTLDHACQAGVNVIVA
jgi:hypothetical protein